MRLKPWPFKFLLLCFIVGTAGSWADAADTTVLQPELSREAQEFFQQKIRPIFTESCYSCHSSVAKKLKGGLRLDFRDGVLQGGDTGPAIVPGEPEKSFITQIGSLHDFSRKLDNGNLAVGERFRLDGAVFDPGVWQLTPSIIGPRNQLVALLKNYPSLQVEISAQTKALGMGSLHNRAKGYAA